MFSQDVRIISSSGYQVLWAVLHFCLLTPLPFHLLGLSVPRSLFPGFSATWWDQPLSLDSDTGTMTVLTQRYPAKPYLASSSLLLIFYKGMCIGGLWLSSSYLDNGHLCWRVDPWHHSKCQTTDRENLHTNQVKPSGYPLCLSFSRLLSLGNQIPSHLPPAALTPCVLPSAPAYSTTPQSPGEKPLIISQWGFNDGNISCSSPRAVYVIV